MGLFKSIGKGIKKTFKSIGRGIKKAFKQFGKFMGKIGVLGQVAMMFILPGIGGALAKGWGAIAGQTAAQVATTATATAAGSAATANAIAAGATKAAAAASGASAAAASTAASSATIAAGQAAGATATQIAAAKGVIGTAKATGLMSMGAVGKGVGTVMNFVGKVVSTPFNVVNNLTSGITNTLSNFAQTASNKMFGTQFAGGSSSFFGPGDSAWAKSTTQFSSRMANITESSGFFDKFDKVASEIPTENIISEVTVDGNPTGYSPDKFQTPSSVTNPLTDKPYNLNNSGIDPNTLKVPTEKASFFERPIDATKEYLSSIVEEGKLKVRESFTKENLINNAVTKPIESVMNAPDQYVNTKLAEAITPEEEFYRAGTVAQQAALTTEFGGMDINDQRFVTPSGNFGAGAINNLYQVPVWKQPAGGGF